MSTQRNDRRSSPIRRRAALATAVAAALAIAAPLADASAATTRDVLPTAAATGPTLIGDTFNGGTAVVTSPSPAVGTVVDSP